jgi:hypothetical protein
MNRSTAFGTLALATLGVLGPTPSVFARVDDEALQRMQAEIQALQQANQRQSEEIQSMKSERGEQWLTEQRAAQIRGVVSDVLADADTRAMLQSTGATAGYDKGFFLASADGSFRLNIKGQVQSRFAYNHVSSGAAGVPGSEQSENEYGFELRRAKLGFSGHVIDPTWRYDIKMAYERNGGVSTNGSGQVQLEEAFFEKELAKGIFLRGGQWKNWFNYEEITSSSAQQLVERSAINQYFSTKFVQGIVLGVQQDWWRGWASYNDGGGNRSIQVIQTQNLTEWALTGRVEFMLAGAWSQFKDMQGWVGSDFAVMLGGAVNWQRGTGVQGIRNSVGNGTIPGAPGGGEQASLVTYTADLNVRGPGWSIFGAFLGNTVYAFAPTASLPNDPTSLGVVLQGGIFLTENLELVARYEGLWVSNGRTGATTANALNSQTLNILTLGANWYFAKNSLKFSLDGAYAFNAVAFNTGLYGESLSGADWRSTINATDNGKGEIVIRAQMQLLF